MGFSLTSASDAARTAHAPAVAGSIAAAQPGTADAGLFAELFAGQLGGAGSAAANDMGAVLGLTAKPASLLPQTAEPLLPAGKPVGGKGKPAAEDVVQNPSAKPVDDALLAQMQAVMPPPLRPATPPPPLAAGDDKLADTPADNTVSSVLISPEAAAEAMRQASAPYLPSVRDAQVGSQAAVQTPTTPPVAVLPPQADSGLPRPGQEGVRQPLVERQPSSLPPLESSLQPQAPLQPRQAQAVGATVTSHAANQPVLSGQPDAFRIVPQTTASAGGQGGDMQQPRGELATAVQAGRSRSEVLPSDVRLLFRREAAQAAADMAASQELAAGSQRQMLPPLMAATPPALPPSGGDWRIEQPMASTPQWREAFGQQVGSMVSVGVDSASIQVSPEHLGPLDIAIRFDQNDKAMISVVAANPEAKSIVEGSLPQLVKMLEQSGIQLGGTQVSTQQQHQASQQAQQQAQEQARQQSGQQQPQHGRSPQGMTAAEEAPAERDMATLSSRQQGLSIQA